jgi:HK97 gp10 family phage protein
MKMKITGINSTFESLKISLENEKMKELRRVSKLMVRDLKEATPVDTGLARDSWKTTERKKSIEVSNDVEYLKYLNEGSSKQAPSHFVEQVALKYGTPLGAITESTN